METVISADAVSRAVIRLPQDLHIGTVAEGVEAAEQIHLLRLLGCDLVQGYYYAHSLEPAEFEALLHSGSAHLDELNAARRSISPL